MTLNRRLRDLEECERIQSLSDLIKIKIEDNNGRGHETTLYNLNVLNHLAMVEMKNKVLNDTAKKFSDILSEVETTGSYSITKPDSYMIEDKIERAKLAEICTAYPDRDQWRRNASYIRIFPKWACDILDKEYDEDSTFLSEYRPV